jgi:hypothetical protein
MRDDEIADVSVLLQRERIAIRAPLDVPRLPVERPVAIGIVIARTVLVDLAVAIVVNALLSEQLVLPRLSGPRFDEHPRVVGTRTVAAVRIAAAHLRDRAVAVEIVRTVLIDEAVAIVVARSHSAARRVHRVRLLHEVLARVRIDRRDDVEDARVEERVDHAELAVHLREIPRGVECDFRPLDLVRMDVAVDVEPGLPRWIAFAEVRHGQRPHLATLRAPSDRRDANEIGMRVGEPSADRGDPVVIVIAIPGDLHLRIRRSADRLEILGAQRAACEHERESRCDAKT